jgi:hypothetical protein
MLPKLLPAFTIIPFVEVCLFIKAGHCLGALNILLVGILAGFSGARSARIDGLRTAMGVRERLNQGQGTCSKAGYDGGSMNGCLRTKPIWWSLRPCTPWPELRGDNPGGMDLGGCRKTPICGVILILRHCDVPISTPHSSVFLMPCICASSISLRKQGSPTGSWAYTRSICVTFAARRSKACCNAAEKIM